MVVGGGRVDGVDGVNAVSVECVLDVGVEYDRPFACRYICWLLWQGQAYTLQLDTVTSRIRTKRKGFHGTLTWNG